MLVLVGVEPTHLKNISQIGNLPRIGIEIKKYLKPPTSGVTWCYYTQVQIHWCLIQGLANSRILGRSFANYYTQVFALFLVWSKPT